MPQAENLTINDETATPKTFELISPVLRNGLLRRAQSRPFSPVLRQVRQRPQTVVATLS